MNKPSHEYCEECESWNGNISNCMEICGIPMDIIAEWEKYQALGTPEELENIVCGMTEQELYREGYKKGIDECGEAVEKQKAKKCYLSGDGDADGHLVYDTYECPNCGKEYEVEYEEYEYCPNCGQHMKLDWSVEE